MPRSCVNRTASRLLWGHRPSTLAGVQLQPPVAHGWTLEVAHCPVATRLVGPPTFCSGWGAAAACRCARGGFRGGTLSGGHQTFDSCRGAAAASPGSRGGTSEVAHCPAATNLVGQPGLGLLGCLDKARVGSLRRFQVSCECAAPRSCKGATVPGGCEGAPHEDQARECDD